MLIVRSRQETHQTRSDAQAALNALIDVSCTSGDLLDQSDLTAVLKLTKRLQRRHMVRKSQQRQKRQQLQQMQLLQLQQGYVLIAPKQPTESSNP